jgi:hypothetical protein
MMQFSEYANFKPFDKAKAPEIMHMSILILYAIGGFGIIWEFLGSLINIARFGFFYGFFGLVFALFFWGIYFLLVYLVQEYKSKIVLIILIIVFGLQLLSHLFFIFEIGDLIRFLIDIVGIFALVKLYMSIDMMERTGTPMPDQAPVAPAAPIAPPQQPTPPQQAAA